MKLNLIFPRAGGGSLADLLRGPRPSSFASDQAFLVALSGLCSAVCSMHNFVSSSHSLKMIGCHHDLKPANVLVEDSKFLLADFGLSKFKDATEPSGTPPRTVHPYYTAPEYCKSEHASETDIVHRSSDIWSLGCIIAEVVTYMLHGANGVMEFAQQRAFERDSIILSRFHRGGDTEPGVIAWLERLRQSEVLTHRMLSDLVRGMLVIQQDHRLGAREVHNKMRFIAIYAACEPISGLYTRVCEEVGSVEAILESLRFQSWRYACNILKPNENQLLTEWTENGDHEVIQATLEQILDRLGDILGTCKTPRRPLFQPLRQLNDLLIHSLSGEGQNHARFYLDTETMLSLSKQLALTNTEEDDSIDEPQMQRLRMLATIKCMNEVLEQRPTHENFIDHERLQDQERVGDFKIQHLRGKDNDDTRQVLVESKTYKEYYGIKNTATELQQRLEDVTRLLQQAHLAAKMSEIRVLSCVGFYQHPQTYSCGIIYDFPNPSVEQKFTTLRLALEESQGNVDWRPSLEQRFELAQTLAKSILQLHVASWLHRSISSFNIAFFYSCSRSWLDGVNDPFLLGFLYSRVNDLKGYTEGPTDVSHNAYQHPDHRERQLRFCAEYDYYSLGLILLEIGLWKPLDKILEPLGKIVKRLEVSAGHSLSLPDLLCLGCVPRLRLSMGSRYGRVVEACLRGRFGVPNDLGEDERQAKLQRSFSELVVERLMECKV